MGENLTTTEKAPKKSKFSGLKAEFSKIAWPDKETLVKHSTAVLVASVALGLIISLLDVIIKFGFGFIIK